MPLFSTILPIILSLFTLFMTGCSAPLGHLKAIEELAENEIILVGRIELVPPLSAAEKQMIRKQQEERQNGNLANIIIGPQHIKIHEDDLRDIDNTVSVELGKEFYLRLPRQKMLYFSGGGIMLKEDNSKTIFFPGGIKLNVPPTQKALYIGTIRYFRDRNNSIENANFVDHYRAARKAFVVKFGRGMMLHKINLEQLH